MTASCTKKADPNDNSFNFAVIGEIKSLDPITVDDVYSAPPVALIYESLYTYHLLKRPLEVVPALAEGLPAVSKDGLTFTIKIKPGARFQDDAAFPNGKGREVTAQDFIYSWKRLTNPKTNSSGFWIFDGKIKGLNEWREKVGKDASAFDAPIEGFSAPDTHTLVIKLTKPNYQILYSLSQPFSSVVAKEAVDKYQGEFANHPVGTGAFMLKEWSRGSRMELVKNPTWRGEAYPSEGAQGDKEKGLLEDAGKPVPFVDRIVINEIVEDQPRWLKFLKGDLDISNIPKDSYDAAITNGQLTPQLKEKNIQLDISNDTDVTYVGFNMEDPIVKNKNLRLAISHALDINTHIKLFFNGRAIAAQSLLAPGLEGYDPEFKNPNRTFDLEKAKAYLKAAGYPGGKGLPPIEYAIASSSTSRQMGEFFAQQLNAIGIQVKIIATSWPQFSEKLRKKQSQVWGFGWNADYPDAENFLQLLYGPNSSPGQNSTNYKNPEYDEVYRKAIATPPGPARTKLYLQMRDIAVRDMPLIPNVHRIQYIVKYPWVHNYKRNPMSWDFYKYIRVDAAKRADAKGSL